MGRSTVLIYNVFVGVLYIVLFVLFFRSICDLLMGTDFGFLILFR